MVPMAPIFRRALLVPFIIIGLYVLFLVALSIPWIQRHALYLHKVQTPTWWADVNDPEQFGFEKSQVTPFTINTPDHETIYAWHVLPARVYAEHSGEIREERLSGIRNISETRAFKYLRDDPEASLNAGNVAQGWRCASYRALSEGNPNTHVLAIDYRGFGLSTGSPTEEGLITDGIAAVNWAVTVAQMHPSQIILFGHSLGTAVAVGVAEHFAKLDIDFAGIILYAGFFSLQLLLSDYSSVGFLAPLKPYPPLLRFFENRVVDTWRTGERLENVLRLRKRTVLSVLHSQNDYEILPYHASELVVSALRGSCTAGGTRPPLTRQTLKDFKNAVTTHYEGGSSYTVYPPRNTDAFIIDHIIPYGYHSRGIASTAVTTAVRDSFFMKYDGLFASCFAEDSGPLIPPLHAGFSLNDCLELPPYIATEKGAKRSTVARPHGDRVKRAKPTPILVPRGVSVEEARKKAVGR